MKHYACPYCGAMLKAKEVHNHVQHTCLKRPKRKVM